MTPGTRVRIHYPGRPYHGMTGAIVKIRRPGRTHNQYLVEFDEPVYFGEIRIDRQWFTRSRLRAIKGAADSAHDNAVVWRDGMPEPRPVEWVEGEADPPLVVVRGGWRMVGAVPTEMSIEVSL